MERLDSHDILPRGMREYLSQNGWHFNKQMCDWAVSRMKVQASPNRPDMASQTKPVDKLDKDTVEKILKTFGITLENDKGYDKVYVANMCRADFYGKSVLDDAHLARFIKDYLDDPDGYEGVALTRFYADCIGSGTPIIWEDML